MDPFTQRMVARARTRRERQESQNPSVNVNAGMEGSKPRNPLQDHKQMQLFKVTTEVELTLSESGKERLSSTVNITPTKPDSCDEDASKENVEVNLPEPKLDNNSAMRDTARSRLKRLGALYADSEISSPIHQTEESFFAEEGERNEVPQQPQYKSVKSGTRLARLAVLADTIKHWEDDLSHPSVATSCDKTSPCRQQLSSDDEQTAEEPVVPRPKQVVWDEEIIASLDDGSTPSRLRPIQERACSEQQPPDSSDTGKGGSGILRSISSGKIQSSPEKRLTSIKCGGSPRTGGVPQMGVRVGSPHRSGDASPRTGSVLHKASLFESNSPTKKNGRDPTELSVSERFALFEHNKGQALIPKAPFSMPVPAKYLENKDKSPQINANSPRRVNKTVGETISQLKKCAEERPNTTVGSVGSGMHRTANERPRNEVSLKPKNEVSKFSPGKAVESSVLQLQKTENNPAPALNDIPTSSSKAMARMFERGNVITADKSVFKSAQAERQREMEMLLNRWNKNRELSSSAVMSTATEQDTSAQPEARKSDALIPPPPPPLPTPADLSPRCFRQNSPKMQQIGNALTEKRCKVVNPVPQYAGLTSLKKIKVSPPKPGRLYPCLSDIEATTETESEMPDDYNSSASDEMESSDDNIRDTSFGREILEAAGIRGSADKQAVCDSSDDESDMESAVLEEIDDFLDEALGENSDMEDSPSPPKKTKDSAPSPKKGHADGGKKPFSSPTTAQSHSFRYCKGSPVAETQDNTTSSHAEHLPSYVVDGNEQVPLMHTVSFYRRQQNMAVKGTPVRQIVRHIDIEPERARPEDEGNVSSKIGELVDEVSKQQTVISQASQALNLCCSTVEFSGSAEQVEGERLLLLATHRRQAALHEIQRLKVEGTMKPGGHSSELTEKGSLIITNVTLPLKKEYLRSMAADEKCHHFVCLVRAQEQVMATPVLAASSENLRRGGGAALIFPGSLKLDGLYSDFKATLEIYNLQTRREMLPHEIKYHIASKKDGNGNKLRLTPKKLLKQESRMVMPTLQSPAGPSAVRSPAFQMSGYVVFSLREVRRTQFTLNKVAYSSPLDGNIQVQLSSELELDVGESGFLTMFEDVSGFGAWHRRWCKLEGATLSYWKYPDDEKKKVPIGQLDLTLCTTQTVGLVSRDICARPHTFLLETTRPAQPDDEESLVLIRLGSNTTIRHLLSADTKDDRVVWCTQLNKALAMLRVWGNRASQHRK